MACLHASLLYPQQAGRSLATCANGSTACRRVFSAAAGAEPAGEDCYAPAVSPYSMQWSCSGHVAHESGSFEMCESMETLKQ